LFLYQESGPPYSLGVSLGRVRHPAGQSIGAGAQEWPVALEDILAPKAQFQDETHDILFVMKVVVKESLKHGHKELGSGSG
jgi:hypothetical protein